MSIIETFIQATKDWPALDEPSFPFEVIRISPPFNHPKEIEIMLQQIGCYAQKEGQPSAAKTIALAAIFSRHESRHAATDTSLAQNGARLNLRINWFSGIILFTYQPNQPLPPSEMAVIACANFPDLKEGDEKTFKKALAEMGLPPDTDPQPYAKEAQRRIASWNLPELR